MKHYDRVWAEVDLDTFRENLMVMKGCLDDHTSIIGVVKTDGYGHGAIPLAREMEEMDFVSGYAVAAAEEAYILKKAGVKKPVMVLGYTFPADYEDMIEGEIRATAFTDRMLEDMSREALRLGKKMILHIAVDTGMSRIGIRPDDSGLSFVKKAMETPGIEIEGLFTHFATADEADRTKTTAQLKAFRSFSKRIQEQLQCSIPVCHCSNSAGILAFQEANMDAVRAGIILYGIRPSAEVVGQTDLKPILSLYSHIVYVKELEAGREISYGGTFTTPKPMRVATIPVGYGDGYPRMLSNKADVLICGHRAPILGRICMDQFMVDVTDIPEAGTGSLVTLIGQNGKEEITMEELGAISGRFHYELACCLGKRIPRVYKKGKKTVYTKDYFEDYK